MSDRCIECGRVIEDDSSPDVSWDDGEPIFVCEDCCRDAEIDNYWANIDE